MDGGGEAAAVVLAGEGDEGGADGVGVGDGVGSAAVTGSVKGDVASAEDFEIVLAVEEGEDPDSLLDVDAVLL